MALNYNRPQPQVYWLWGVYWLGQGLTEPRLTSVSLGSWGGPWPANPSARIIGDGFACFIQCCRSNLEVAFCLLGKRFAHGAVSGSPRFCLFVFFVFKQALAKIGPRLTAILLLQPPKCWGYRYEARYPADTWSLSSATKHKERSTFKLMRQLIVNKPETMSQVAMYTG